MKAPLRYAFGWVIYVAILALLNPVVSAIFDAFQEQPLLVTIITGVLGMVLFAVLFLYALRPFWSWCDEPRKTTREVSPCS